MLAGGATSIAILASFPGSLSDSIVIMLKAAGDQNYSEHVVNYAISIKSLIGRISCLLRGELFCDIADQNPEFIASPWLGLVIAIGLIVVVYVLIRVRVVPPILWMSVLVSLGIIAVPDGPIYQASLVTVVVAVLTVLPNSDSLENWKWSSHLLIFAIVISSIPLTIYIRSSPYPFRSFYMTIPVVWLIYIVTVCIEAALLNRRSVLRK